MDKRGPLNSPRFIFYIYIKKMLTKKDALAAEFYWNYINNVKEDDVVKALRKNAKDFKKFLEKIPRKKIDHSYAEGKWTIREMIQHVIDSERVFSYRSISFSRKDPTPLPGFDEQIWAKNAEGAARKWEDLIDEFSWTRKSTEALFGSFGREQLLSEGVASGKNINTLALGYICTGHVIHHMNIIKERYL